MGFGASIQCQVKSFRFFCFPLYLLISHFRKLGGVCYYGVLFASAINPFLWIIVPSWHPLIFLSHHISVSNRWISFSVIFFSSTFTYQNRIYVHSHKDVYTQREEFINTKYLVPDTSTLSPIPTSHTHITREDISTRYLKATNSPPSIRVC
jgi:hypothetical protein